MNTDLESYQGGTPEPYDRPQVPTIAGTRARLPEVGRIRLGDVKQPNKPGAKLGTFRFTSRDRSLIEAVAARYGGQVKPWDSDEGHQWQVISESSTVAVVVPRADLAFSQYYELWSGGGCQRRCDGQREMIGDRQCVCDPAARECKPTTRLSVMLPGVRGMGLWRVESHGDNARAEILGSIELASMYGASLVPANLTVVERWSRQPNPKKPGEFVKVRFVIPILVISDSIDEYVARAKEMQAAELGLLPSGNDLAGATTMRKLRATVFALWPESDQPGPERDRRLRQLSHMLGREVPTISNDHDLTEAEARRLASMVNELHEDPIDESTPALNRGQAAPDHSSRPMAAGADHMQGHTIVESPAWAPDPEGSAGAHGDAEEPEEASAVRSGAPAEHHTEPSGGQAATTERDQSSEAGDGKPLPSGGASAPTGKRRSTDLTGAPGVKEAMAQAQQFRDERKAQTETWQPPSNWLQTLPPEAVYNLVTYFERGGARDPNYAAEAAARAFARHRVSPSMPPLASWTENTDWSPAQLAQLAAETWDRPARKGDPE